MDVRLRPLVQRDPPSQRVEVRHARPASPWRIGRDSQGEEISSGGSEEEAPGAMEGACGEKPGRGTNGMAQSGEGWKSAGNFNPGKATGRLTDTEYDVLSPASQKYPLIQIDVRNAGFILIAPPECRLTLL